MDPIADKILVISAFVAFVQMRLVPAWMVVLVLTRELLMTGVRLVAHDQAFEVTVIGKHKTATQMGGILWVLAILVLRELPVGWIPPEGIRIGSFLNASIFWVLFVTVWVTVGSGLLYLWRHRFLFTGNDRVPS